jgi:ABC-type branched-subunit amino acid transport system ATPase component
MQTAELTSLDSFERSTDLLLMLILGEQPMPGIGRTLTLNPKVLLLDEPTEGLAPTTVDEWLKGARHDHPIWWYLLNHR